MIFVRRPPPPQKVLDALAKRTKGALESEPALARRHYARVPAPTKAYPFKVYKEPDVGAELDALFYRKCAYCESHYAAVDARDIEHFRPKGGVAQTNPPHPGYWWLASKWENLFPSCQACNRRRKHCTFESGQSLEDLDRAYAELPDTLTGKGESFPLHPPTTWVTTEGGDLATEDPLLINPCERDPVRHMEWVFDWDRTKAMLWEAEDLIVSVRPTQVDGVDDPYGKASIAIYGLRRVGLVGQRIARALMLQKASLEIIRDLKVLALMAGGPAEAELQRQLAEHRRELMSLGSAKQPYAGMARAYIALFQREMAAWPAKLS